MNNNKNPCPELDELLNKLYRTGKTGKFVGLNELFNLLLEIDVKNFKKYFKKIDNLYNLLGERQELKKSLTLHLFKIYLDNDNNYDFSKKDETLKALILEFNESMNKFKNIKESNKNTEKKKISDLRKKIMDIQLNRSNIDFLLTCIHLQFYDQKDWIIVYNSKYLVGAGYLEYMLEYSIECMDQSFNYSNDIIQQFLYILLNNINKTIKIFDVKLPYINKNLIKLFITFLSQIIKHISFNDKYSKLIKKSIENIFQIIDSNTTELIIQNILINIMKSNKINSIKSNNIKLILDNILFLINLLIERKCSIVNYTIKYEKENIYLLKFIAQIIESQSIYNFIKQNKDISPLMYSILQILVDCKAKNYNYSFVLFKGKNSNKYKIIVENAFKKF